MPTTPSSFNLVEEVQTTNIGDTLVAPPSGSGLMFINQNGGVYVLSSAGVASPVGGLVGAGALLARSQYAPSSADTVALTVATTGLTALNFTTGGNVPTVTFKVPPSGAVLVRGSVFIEGGAAAGTSVILGLTSTTSAPGTVVGVTGLAGFTPTATAADDGQIYVMTQVITGLTQGTSEVWYLAAMYSGTQPTAHAHGPTAQTTVPTGAPAVLEVWSA